MKNTIILLMLLISITGFSQEKKEQTRKEQLEVYALQFRKEFMEADLSFSEFMEETNENYGIAENIKNSLPKMNKEKVILILTVQKKSVKWYKFKQRGFYRKQIREAKKL